MHLLRASLTFVLFGMFQVHIDANIPDENHRLNSLLYNSQVPMPSMYLPLNCDSFKQKGIIAWMIHEGIDVPEEDKILFRKCGNIDKDYIVGETFLFGERNVEKMTRYSMYLRKLLQGKPKGVLHQSQNVSKDNNRTNVILSNHLEHRNDTSQVRNVHHKVTVSIIGLHRTIAFLSVLMLIITVVSAVVTIFAFINYREHPGKIIQRYQRL